jgi:hypothetical protein
MVNTLRCSISNMLFIKEAKLKNCFRNTTPTLLQNPEDSHAPSGTLAPRGLPDLNRDAQLGRYTLPFLPMALNAAWQRPFSEAAEAKTTGLTYTLTENAGRAVIDVTATINSETKILARILITPQSSGSTLTHQVKHLIFPGDDTSDYTSATNPADSEASNATTAVEVVLPDSLNLDSFYTDAGVNRTDPTP